MAAADFGRALRTLWRTPGFTAAAVLTLALGIGANSAIFSVIDTVLLRPMPFPGAERIVSVWETKKLDPNRFPDPKSAASQMSHWLPDDTAFNRWNTRGRSFEVMAGFRWIALSLTGAGEPERLDAAAVTPGFFDLIGMQPALGRAIAPEEDRVGNNQVAVLSHHLWMRRFGGAAGIVGSKILLDGVPHTVIGVMPAKFDVELPGVGRESELLVPMSRTMDARRRFALFSVGARMKRGVSLAQAREDLAAVTRELAAEQPRRYRDTGVNLVPMAEEMAQQIRPALWILLGASGCVLLIACTNLASLLLTRAVGRAREQAVRAVLGAGGWDLARQCLAESLTLALAGGIAGAFLSRWAVSVLLALAPEGMIPRSAEIGADARVLGFGLAVSLLAGLATALVPAWQAMSRDSQRNLHEVLKEGGRSGPGIGGRRLRRALVVAEIAVAFVILAGAGLLMRSFVRLMGVNPGFQPEHVLSAQMNLPAARYSAGLSRVEFSDRILDRVRALPGVSAAAITNTLPIQGGTTWSTSVLIEGRPKETGEASVFLRSATADYFAAMGMTLRRGRMLTAADATRNVAMVNEAMVRRYWPDARRDPAAPLGRLQLDDKWFEIVGVTSDVKYDGLDKEPSAEMYVPFQVLPATAMALVVRTTGDPMALVPAVRAAVWSVDRDQPLERMQSLEQAIARSVSTPRFRMVLFGVFAGLGLVLAAVGIYGTIAYAVSQRTHEIGVRMAMGAEAGRVLRMVIWEGLALAAAGVTLGIAGAVAVTHVLRSFLFGVTPTDFWTLALVSVLLVTVAVAASFVPARRATEVDPTIALRWE